jgi:hypothetical protein
MAKVLKYDRVRLDLLNYIAREGYIPGDKLPTERELVTRFNLSTNSLRKGMEILAEQGVIEKIQGLGTFLRKPVKDLEMQGKIVLLDIQDSKPYTVPMLARELQLLLEERRMDFQFVPAVTPGAHLHRMFSDATGIFVIGRITPEWATYLELVRQPLLVLGSNPFPERFHTVTYDWRQASYLLTSHFLGRGFKTIGLVNGEIDYFPAQRMYQGYRQALADHGVAFDEKRVVWPTRFEQYNVMNQFLHREQFDAVLVEMGAVFHLFNWLWNHPDVKAPLLGVMEDMTMGTHKITRSDRIVSVRYAQKLLSEAISIFFKILGGQDGRISHVLTPELVLS